MSEQTLKTDAALPVLYVDDEEANLVVVQTMLQDDVPLLLANSGADALDILRKHRVDVLITDHRMPGMTGIELCAAVGERYPDVQRVLVTAFTDHDTAVEAINRGGVSRYLQKPFGRDLLLSVVAEAQAQVVRQMLSRELHAAIQTSEQLRYVAEERGRVLEDLANVTNQVRLTCDELESLAPDLHAEVSLPVFDRLHEEIADLRVAVDFLTSLHRRVQDLRPVTSEGVARHHVEDLLYGAATVARVATPPHAQIRIDCAPGLAVVADRTDLGRVLVALLNDAAAALGTPDIPVGSEISIRAGSQSGRVQISVSHDGSRHRALDFPGASPHDGGARGHHFCRPVAHGGAHASAGRAAGCAVRR